MSAPLQGPLFINACSYGLIAYVSALRVRLSSYPITTFLSEIPERQPTP